MGGAAAYTFTAELWRWKGDSAWHFVTLPFDVADEIEEVMHGRTNGFGSVKVSVTVGSTTWATSLFPDTKAESYLLPVKAQVRSREGLAAGSAVTVHLTLV
ncbi:MAG TPA: DUF1905 domain-containing protein [Acidimicrobiaceae bacterium]|nr:DUF1905 domain-containing protein [Acidimicrobiaceae bacterium]